jgi:hypothetical protein
LVELVRDTDDKHKTLAADSVIKKAVGEWRLGPSDWFKNLAANIGITKKGAKDRSATASGEAGPPQRVRDAAEELKLALAQLRTVKLQKNSTVFEERSRRRDDTIMAIEDALAKRKLGACRPVLLDKATELNDGYTGSMAPMVRDAVKEAAARLIKAAALLSDP